MNRPLYNTYGVFLISIGSYSVVAPSFFWETQYKTIVKLCIYRGGKIRSSSYAENVDKIGRLVDNNPGIHTSIVYYDQVTRSTTPLIGN